MSKELATQNTSRYVQALYNINAGSSSLDGRDILKLTAEGMWVFGQDNAEVDEQEDVFVINPESFREGYIAFDDKNNLAVTIDDKDADFLWQIGSAPAIEDHEDDHPLEQPKSNRAPRIEYRHQLAIDLVCIEGPNKGAQLVYKSTSQGGRKMLGKLAGEIARRKERGDDDYVPSISLWADDYWSRKWGRTIWNPQAEILDWYTMEDDVLKETPEKAAKRDDKRAAAKPARNDRKGAAKSGVEDDTPRDRGRRDERDREVDTSDARRRAKPRNVEPEEPEYDKDPGRDEAIVNGNEERRSRREAVQEDRPRGRGRPEREERERGRGRPTRGDDADRHGRSRRDEEPEEEERAPRRAAGGRGRR